MHEPNYYYIIIFFKSCESTLHKRKQMDSATESEHERNEDNARK